MLSITFSHKNVKTSSNRKSVNVVIKDKIVIKCLISKTCVKIRLLFILLQTILLLLKLVSDERKMTFFWLTFNSFLVSFKSNEGNNVRAYIERMSLLILTHK